MPLLVYRWRRGTKGGRILFSSLAMVKEIPRTLSLRLQPMPGFLRLVAIFLIILGLARPQRGLTQDRDTTQGVDILLALDISYSMMERDFGGESRLAAAKKVLKEFIQERTRDRLGLVAFAGETLPLSPLTTDQEALMRLVDRTENGMVPDGTAIGMAISNGVNLLRESKARSRIMILLTDGQNTAGEIPPLKAAQVAQAMKIKVYSIGVGGPISQRRGFPPSLASPFDIDEETLKEIARISEGTYFRASNEQSLRDIYHQIGALEKSDIGRQKPRQVEELSTYLFLPALFLLIGEVALSQTLLRRIP